MAGVTQLHPKKDDKHEPFFRELVNLCKKHGVHIQRGGQVFFVQGRADKISARFLLHTVDEKEAALETLQHDPKQLGYQVITVEGGG
jgi:hypothetical protein